MRHGLRALALTACLYLSAGWAAARPSDTLAIYFIDVEGGQSTLLVTPAGESLLVDTGWAGDGSPGATPGDLANARDAHRIEAAARDAGIHRIDYLLITHFHPDHEGGAVELSRLLPIRHFIDHGSLTDEGRRGPGMVSAYDAYMAVRNRARHMEPKPGQRLPLHGVDAIIVSSAAATLTSPLPGAGQPNTRCGSAPLPARDAIENPRSTGLVASFGHFRFLDIGDLSGAPLFELVCPRSLIGPIDVYLVAHHGGADVADPATFAAFNARVAVINNGMKKGGARETFETLHLLADRPDVWQLHRSEQAADLNFEPSRIANPDESSSFWIKITAAKDGSFRVYNGRTGESKSYAPH